MGSVISELDPGRSPAIRNAVGTQVLPSGWNLASHAWGATTDQPGFPDAEQLSAAEWQRIREGWTVGRELKFDYRGNTYVGGVAHQIIRADSAEILESLLDEEQVLGAFPLTKTARVVDRDRAGVAMEFVQGNAPAQARYTLRMTRDRQSVRLNLLKDRDNSVRDVLGYITATPFTETHTLVTLAVGVDLGSELKRAIFQHQVQKAALALPAHMRRYLETRDRSN